jgi:hypothetical protein
MMMDSAYETGSDPGTGLTRYMGDGHDLRDASGRELDDDEIEQFNDECAENGFSRQIVLAPERTDLDEDELDKAARKTMNELTEGHNTSEYVYAVHEDTDHPHVHVAATATEDSGEMWLEEDDLNELRDEIAADHFRDHSTERQKEIMRQQGREEELQREEREKELADTDEQPAPVISSDQDDHDHDQEQDDMMLYAAAAGELSTFASPESMPISILAEAYRERQREQEQENEHEHEHNRGRSR